MKKSKSEIRETNLAAMKKSVKETSDKDLNMIWRCLIALPYPDTATYLQEVTMKEWSQAVFTELSIRK